MKQILTLFLLFFVVGMHAQTIYVKSNATGANDGTSWANAFTSLDAALSGAGAGQSVWVAGGTYKPSNPAPNNSFVMRAGVNLYGGFAGTETALNQRNIILNPTILSGDIAGNDIAGNFTSNRTDNSQHVLIVFVETDNPGGVVDGFLISHGHTLTGTTNPDLTRRGGGLIINAKTEVRNCAFSDNFGESGAGVYLLGDLSDGSVLNNCIFQNNKATTDGVAYARASPTGVIKNCTFRNNATDGGALLLLETTDYLVDSCLFERNIGPDYCSGLFSWQATFTLSNSIFRKNKAANAAAVYIDGRDGGDFSTISNCLFEQDSTTDYGGSCIFSNEGVMDISNCTFKNNVAPSSGAAFYNGNNSSFYIRDCVFDGNKAAFAAAIANYGEGCKGIYEGCTFMNNTAASGGGALSNGFEANVTYKRCNFTANHANYGGAIFTQNANTELHIEDCVFNQNTASGNVGSSGCITVNDSVVTSIVKTTFSENSANIGGACSISIGYPVNIDKCQFIDNVAQTQGAALNISAGDITITNSLFARNINTSTAQGAGGAISNNASVDEHSTVKAVNCTFADNVAPIGGGIAQWEDENGAFAQTTLLNCLFQNPDSDNYGIEAGEPEVFSSNGNQSSDATLETYLTQSKDKKNTFNTFQDPNGNNYAHTLGSPASDGGVSAGAPADDILGVPRTGTPDVGYREVKTTGTNNIDVKVVTVTCAPNPSADMTVVSFKNETMGKVQINLFNALGQRVAGFQALKISDEFSYNMNVANLPAGNYKLQVQLGGAVHEGAFAKM